jgi:hypothetical protein
LCHRFSFRQPGSLRYCERPVALRLRLAADLPFRGDKPALYKCVLNHQKMHRRAKKSPRRVPFGEIREKSDRGPVGPASLGRDDRLLDGRSRPESTPARVWPVCYSAHQASPRRLPAPDRPDVFGHLRQSEDGHVAVDRLVVSALHRVSLVKDPGSMHSRKAWDMLPSDDEKRIGHIAMRIMAI